MAMRELPLRTATVLGKSARPAIRTAAPLLRRNASSEAVKEVEDASSFEVPPPAEELVKSYDPVARSRLRRRGNKQLPPSRYGPSYGTPANALRSCIIDTSTARPSTTAVPSTPTSRRQSRIHLRVSTSLDLLVSPVSSKPTRARSPRTCSPSHTNTIPQATEPPRPTSAYASGPVTRHTLRTVPCDLHEARERSSACCRSRALSAMSPRLPRSRSTPWSPKRRRTAATCMLRV